MRAAHQREAGAFVGHRGSAGGVQADKVALDHIVARVRVVEEYSRSGVSGNHVPFTWRGPSDRVRL